MARRIRHIIVEGMDGSGKTTLIEELVRELGFTKAPRASTSEGGPIANLDAWVIADMLRMKSSPEPLVYDRHPLISEPIYGPICRGKVPGCFQSPEWIKNMKAQAATRAMVVWCHPPFEAIQKVIERTAQMPGVLSRARALYLAYYHALWTWPSVSVTYDRTRSTPLQFVARISPILREL